MGFVAKAVAWILFFMSMWSIGVAVERIYTFIQAKNQSKVYAPQVAKHLKDGRLKDAIAISTNKNYRYSHLAKVVLAGLQEYQFQQENAGGLSREELLDTVRRLDSARDRTHRERPEEGRQRPGDHRRRPRRSSDCSGRSSASSTRSPVSRPRARVASAPSLPVSRKRLSKRRSVSLVAIPAVWFLDYLTGRIEYLNVEMDNSSSELVDYSSRRLRN